jgi:hypothetical protein
VYGESSHAREGPAAVCKTLQKRWMQYRDMSCACNAVADAGKVCSQIVMGNHPTEHVCLQTFHACKTDVLITHHWTGCT